MQGTIDPYLMNLEGKGKTKRKIALENVTADKWKPAFYTQRKNKSSDGDEIISFAQNYFNVLKGFRSGEPLMFTNWQKWLLRSLYERNDVTGRLRYRRALIGLPRKQGKSLMMSAVGVYGMIAGESGSEVYAVANDRQQARIIFNEAKQQIVNSPLLAAESKVYRDAIEMPRFGSVFRVLSSDFKGQAGLNPSLVLFDELWGQNNSDLYDQMTLGSGARIEPLTVSITTAGYDLDSLAGKLYQYGKQVAAGEVEDDQFGFWWWEAPEDCKVDDRKAWQVSNPNLAEGLLDPDDLAVAVKQTSEMGMRRWRLNQWVRSQESWLPAGAWEQCRDTRELQADLPIYVGIDMALKHDSIAVVIAQPQDDVVISGERNLLSVTDFSSDMGQLRRAFDLFEQKAQLVRLLDISAQAEGVRIYIGGESQIVPMEELSVVSAPYEIDGQVVGTLGVIGPTRMAYDRMIQIVDITSKLVSNALSHK
jgi:phage terminase large subunit-like protein